MSDNSIFGIPEFLQPNGTQKHADVFQFLIYDFLGRSNVNLLSTETSPMSHVTATVFVGS